MSLLIYKDTTIKLYYSNPFINSYKFKSDEKFYNNVSLATLMIANYNLNFIKSPHLLLEDPTKFVTANNLKFPQGLGKVSGITKYINFIDLNYEDFCTKIVSILTNNLEHIVNNKETYYKLLPTENLKKQSFKTCLQLKNELNNIKSDPFYLHMFYEAICVLLNTKKNDCMLKG